MTSNRRPPLALRASVIAVQGALAVLATVGMAHAADDQDVLELVKPANTIEAGLIYVDKDSYKQGEYNGLYRKGPAAQLNFDIRGGSAYERESGGIERWRAFGSNLGLQTRSLGAEYSQQGVFGVRFEYDELRRSYSDSFKTLWTGGGTTALMLPGGYPSAAARAGTSGLFNWNNIQAPNLNATTTGGGPGYVIPALMQGFNVSTLRQKTGLAGDVELTPNWSLSVNARNEKKSGTKLTGVAMGGFKGAIVPEPIDNETSIIETAVRWRQKDAHFNIGWNASFFRNRIDGWTVEYPFSTGSGAVLNGQSMMNGAPDNQMHQVFADAGWKFSPTMRLVVAGSHTRMTQNEPFRYQGSSSWSVNGGALSSDSREVQENLLVRLSAQPMPNLDLNAAFKYDHRDNRSPLGTYKVTQYDSPSVPSASNVYNNVPLNRKQDQFMLDARYNLGRAQAVTAGYEHMTIERTADGVINPLSNEINNPFASAKAKEDSFKLGYRQVFTDAVSGQLAYAHSRRRAEHYEHPEVNPPGSSANVGYYQEVPGFRQFFLNDRNRDKVRAAVDFQPTEALYIQAGVDYIKDSFPGGEYGLKHTSSQAWNLDGTYTHSDKLSFNGFVTFEDAKSKQEQFQLPVARTTAVPAVLPHTPDGTCAPYSNATGMPADYLTDPCRLWSLTQADKIWTVGLGVKSSQLMGGKLTLTGDLSYSRARTNQNFTGGTYYNNGLTSMVYIPAQDMGQITSSITDVKLGAVYAYNKQSAVKVGLLHRKLRSSDPQFDLYGVNSVQAFIGTGSVSPTYNVNVVTVSYVYTFR